MNAAFTQTGIFFEFFNSIYNKMSRKCIANTQGGHGPRCKNNAQQEGLCRVHLEIEGRRQLYCDLCAQYGGYVAGPATGIPPPPPLPPGGIPPLPPLPPQGLTSSGRPIPVGGRQIISAQDLLGVGLRHTERGARADTSDSLYMEELDRAVRRARREFVDPLATRVPPPFRRDPEIFDELRRARPLIEFGYHNRRRGY